MDKAAKRRVAGRQWAELSSSTNPYALARVKGQPPFTYLQLHKSIKWHELCLRAVCQAQTGERCGGVGGSAPIA